jgi:epoxyqueuosine reductase QueG
VALGNGVADQETIGALHAHLGGASPLVQEHIAWALQRLLKGC